MMLRVGFAKRDIAPIPGITLSGFAARCNAPMTGQDDPLEVRALVIEQDGMTVLLMVFDLLGLGPELTARVESAIRRATMSLPTRPHCVLLCTHTHSAPATVALLGCGIPDERYWRIVEAAAGRVAAEALACRQSAVMRLTTVSLAGENRNRRNILADGRVVMTPATPPRRVGPTYDTALVLRFDAPDGRGLAGLIHWAAHPDTVCSLRASADFPGELRKRMESVCGFPFLYVQGPCGNLNPPFRNMTREEMLENIDRLMTILSPVAWPAVPCLTTPFVWREMLLDVPYAALADRPTLETFRHDMARFAEGHEASGSGMAILSDILNAEPGSPPPSGQLMSCARIMAGWAEGVLALKAVPPPCPVRLSYLRCGSLAFCFAGVEPFVETAQALQTRAQGLTVALAGYASPLAGYLPTAQALREGGYEAAYAYRFYGHPAPFAADVEERVVNVFAEWLAEE